MKSTGLSPRALKGVLYTLARQKGARGRITLLGGWPSWEDIEALEACWARNVSRRVSPCTEAYATARHTPRGFVEIELTTR